MAMYLGSNKVEIGVNSGGGGSWVTLTEESVTVDGQSGTLTYNTQITADTIKVTLNGTEYTVSPTVDTAPFGTSYTYGAPWSEELDRYDYSTYPFSVVSTSNGANVLHTESAGTYSIKIEAPQSGGSSDFSTAEVTVTNTNNVSGRTMYGACALDDGEDTGSVGSMGISASATMTFLVILYKGVAWISAGNATIVSVSGSAEKLGSSMVMVTGDCTITIS